MTRWQWRVRRHTYRSSIDDSREPFRVYVPRGYRRKKACPLVALLHGFGGDQKGWIGERTAGLADARGYLLLAPRGRGSTFYDGVGERDVLDALDRATARYRVDDDRVYLMGTSMGGTGALRLACRYPDRFAAVVAVCGWTDWRLWYRHWYAPADRPRHVESWRRPLLERASALPPAENLRNLPVLVLHGARDSTVRVENSRKMFEALRRGGADVVYKEYARSKHTGFRSRWAMAFDWFEGTSLKSRVGGRDLGPPSPPGVKRRAAAPSRVIYRSDSPCHAGAYWVRIDARRDPNTPARIEAQVKENRVIVRVRAVEALTLTPPLDGAGADLRVGRQRFDAPPGRPIRLRRSGGRWELADDESARPPAMPEAGPIGDAFASPFRLVTGSAPEDRAEAEFFASLWARWMLPLDGKGRPRRKCVILTDREIRPRHIRDYNLVLFGRPHTHAVLANIAADLPIRIDCDRVRIEDRTYRGPHVGLRMVSPNPLNPRRSVVVWFGHLPLRAKDLEGWPWLLPDYAIFDERRTCGRTVHPSWESYDRRVAEGEIDPDSVPEPDKPQLYLPDCFLDAGFLRMTAR